jgi:hypothetical protein
MADPFVLFVRPVKGFAVPRYGTAELLGATKIEPKRRVNDEAIVWDTDTIVPLTDDYRRRYVRELNRHLRKGELVECSREEWAKQQAPATSPSIGNTPGGES